jgi:hypothetical protein
VAGDLLQMVNDKTGEIVAEHPLYYTDRHFREFQIEGRLGDWIEGASLDALAMVWEMAENDRQRIFEIKCRIAATVHHRLGHYGGQWHVHAARLLRCAESVARDYAYIWERLGSFIEDDARLLDLGYDLLRHAAFSEEPERKLATYAAQRDTGIPVKRILAGDESYSPRVDSADSYETTSPYGSGRDARGRPIPALCRHEYERVCRHCGSRANSDVR